MTTEPPVRRRLSYNCYNCNYAFHITPTSSSSSSTFSVSSFRCPRCHHRHFMPHHTVSPPDSASLHHTFDNSDSDSDSDYEYHPDDDTNSLLNPNFYPTSESFVASLPIKNSCFPPNSSIDLSCSICMEDFEIHSRTINQLPCEHYFHKDCIVEWLRRSNTCPLCRYTMPAAVSEGLDTHVFNTNGGGLSLTLDLMRDEDGDVFMVDA